MAEVQRNKGDWHYKNYIRYREALRSKKALTSFEWLVKHYHGYAPAMQDPERIPLKDLISNYDGDRRMEQLTTEINHMIPIVTFIMVRRSNIIPIVEQKIGGEVIETDLLHSFFNWPDDQRQRMYDLLIQSIERSRGIFNHEIKLFERSRFWSPTYWVSWFLSWPIRVLHLSGFNVETEKTSRSYFLILKGLMVAILTLAVYNLGFVEFIQKIAKNLF